MRFLRRRSSHSFQHPAAVWGKLLTCLVLLMGSASMFIGFPTALSFLAILGFVSAIAGVQNPFLGLFGVGLLTVIDPVTRHLLLSTGGLLRWNSFNYWLMAYTLLFLPRAVHLSDPHSRLLRFLVIVLAIGLATSTNAVAGMQTLLNAATVFALVIYFQRTPRDAQTMYWLGVVMSVTAAVGGFAFYSAPANSMLMNKNAFALFPLAGVIGACLGFPFAGRIRGGSLLLISLATLNLLWVFLSLSRGTFVVALLAMVFMLMTTRSVFLRVAYVVAGVVIVVGLSARFERLEGSAIARFLKVTDQSLSSEERTSGRSNLAAGGWAMFRQNPLGIGTGSFERGWSKLEQPDITSRWRPGMQIPPHSAWVMILAENGIPGIMLFVGYVASFALVGLARHDRYLLRLGLFVTIALSLGFMFTEFQSKALWMLAAAATALLHHRAPAYAQLSRRESARSVATFDRPNIANA
jgi:O-antigen ligase